MQILQEQKSALQPLSSLATFNIFIKVNHFLSIKGVWCQQETLYRPQTPVNQILSTPDI